MIAKNLTLEFIDNFLSDLPYKPYCTDELGVIHIRPKQTAIEKKYLQINQPSKCIYLIFDVDREGAVLSWLDNDLPPPNWTTKNNKNAHAHLAYKLEVPVCISDMGREAVIRYLAAIESAMIQKLNADRAYIGLLTKNPLNDHWYAHNWRKEPYSLEELADYLDLKGHPLKGVEAVGIGRNVELFESSRKWAYKAIREYWQPEYKDKWFNAVYEHVESVNTQFITPLTVSEVKAIAKSIAKWTYKHFTPEKLSQWHAKKGSKGGKVGGKIGGKVSKRGVKADSERTLKPWDGLGISRATYYRRKKLSETK